ncbi:MAG: glutathione S-transferase family protein [Betaproteobacteria bacterium]|nr:glutathione S-transferase family protein [Betaproteobacteria bacterium]
MKLYMAQRAPNPKRVCMFLAEKGIDTIEWIAVDLNAGAHRDQAFVSKNPLARVPVLELDDGRYISESRAICSWIEAHNPEPSLMGETGEARAFIEMYDRYVEWYLLLPTAQWIRHAHPGLVALENPQFPDFAENQAKKRETGLAWLEERLSQNPWVAGSDFTIADITAFCAIEFSRVMKFKPAEAGYAQIQHWRDRVAARPSASAGDHLPTA